MSLSIFSVISLWLFVSLNNGLPVTEECQNWTTWFDSDDPAGTGEFETLEVIRTEFPNQVCDSPTAIDVRLTDGRPISAVNEVVSASTTEFVCINRQQSDNQCEDYEVRFCCNPPKPECTNWTKFYDRDNPSGTGDWEHLSALRKENRGQICEKPDDVEAQLTDGRPYTAGGDKITLSPSVGLICRNNEQTDGNRCDDYKVRFCCPKVVKPDCTWTKFYDRDNPSGSGDWEHLSALRKENRGQICEKPVDVEAQLTDGRPHAAGGDTITLSPSVGLICKNNQQTSGNRCDDYKVRFCCPKVVKPDCTWTKFYDRDNPSGSGDWEHLSALRKENRGQICEKPVDVEAQLTDGRPHAAGGDTITLSPSVGLICKNNQQTSGNRCDDYKVRFCCPKVVKPDCTWTKFYDRDNPSGSGDWEHLSALRNENKGQICEKPVNVEAQLTDGRPHAAGGDTITLSPSVGLICKNNQQTSGNKCDDYKVRFCCPAPPVSTP